MKIIVIGGGAAGFFAAITCATTNPEAEVILLEKSRKLLSKVHISGGGRCNVTHACFEPGALVQYYPRGTRELRSCFSQFQPKDTVRWFEERGVLLKTEEDGRMFPISDSSQTIIDCLVREAKKAKVEVRTEMAVLGIEKGFIVHCASEKMSSDRLILATGSSKASYSWLTTLGHTIQPPVPSLFTFNIRDFPLEGLAGISIKKVKVQVDSLVSSGPLLITHWGFSGPAILRLSSFGARLLHDKQYKQDVIISWIPDIKQEVARKKIEDERAHHPKRLLYNSSPFDLPHNLWKALLGRYGISDEKRLSDLANKEIQHIVSHLTEDHYFIDGQTTYKEEFVTCGGITLNEVNFKTMESKIVPKLYFAGELLDIDGITGGFNFQNAWTTGYIAGKNSAW